MHDKQKLATQRAMGETNYSNTFTNIKLAVAIIIPLGISYLTTPLHQHVKEGWS